MTNEAPGRATGGNSNTELEGINLDSEYSGQHRHQDIDDSIYPRGVPLYRKAGWRAPLPFPPGKKAPPPTGYTGYEGRWPDGEQIDHWARDRPLLANPALRLDYGLIGIDVDAYEPKAGGWTLREAESRWGVLPATWRSTARIVDDVSGIRVFRVPLGVFFRSVIQFKELGLGDIEIIQPHHRYVTAWPSIHPKLGQRYRWIDPEGALLPEGEVPRVEDIPELPEAWVTGLAKDSVREEFFDGSAPNRPREEDAIVDEEVYHRLAHLVDNGMPDAVVSARAEKALLELTAGSSNRYDTTRNHVAALMRFHSWGRAGVPRVLAQMFDAYVAEVGDTRPRVVAEAEFRRFTEGAVLLIAASRGRDPWSTLGMDGPGTAANGASAKDGGEADSARWGGRMVTGGAFVLDAPEVIETLWGSDDRVIWAAGEGLMLTGTQGVGKTTLAQQIVLSLLRVIDGSVLGLPVLLEGCRVLYLAMDRPNQIRRAFRRQCRDEHRHLLDENLVVWKGPPPADLAKHPELLTELAERAQSHVVVVDSLKDAAVGLSEDEVGSGWNRAAQGLLATGRNLLVLHHRKKQAKNTRTSLDDVYGSTWLTSGMGSVVLLDGNPGDPLVEFRHLKFPVTEVGPMKVSHDQATGLMTVAERADVVAVARTEGKITVKRAAELLYGSISASTVEKARRQLEKQATAGKLVKKDDGRVTAYYPPFGPSSPIGEQPA